MPLVERARAGDPFAFDQLVRRFQDKAVGYALTLLGDDRASAEDAAQEAFLEAYRCLPTLQIAAAFPGWVRRLVFKHCDRTRRGKPETAVSLESVQHRLYDAVNLETDLIRRQEARRVREAIHSLPCGEREVTALFYLSGCPAREIAAFLEISEVTVRTRLHRARLRLRKDLVKMEIVEMKTQPVQIAPENPVAARVLGGIVAEYLRQRKDDPEAADRSLLAQARRQLEDRLSDSTPLDPETARSGDSLLSLVGENGVRADLMRRYQTQPLSVSEEAWARYSQINALSGTDRWEETVAEQDSMYLWAAAAFPQMPPRLSREQPFLPIETADSATEIYPQNTLLLWVHDIPDAPDHWVNVGRADEWLRRFDEILGGTPATHENRQQRYYFLRTALRILFRLGRAEEAEKLLVRVEALADEETDPLAVFHWRGHAIYLRMIQAKGDAEALRQVGNRAAVLLSLYEQALKSGETSPETTTRFFILRDNIASVAADHGLYTLAVPLLTSLIVSGNGSPWNCVRLAQCVWTTTHNRADTLRLIRQGALRIDRENLWDWAKALPAFAAVAEDPEFIAAASYRG
ncbi:MAG: sigma-70 family RNA polymerase sigma factor [Cytophagales bacterium]|nr:sigma-70 family RNA polymerase sigma factor [Armatimonadota bacterium]